MLNPNSQLPKPKSTDGPRELGAGRWNRLPQLVNVCRQQLAKAAETLVTGEVGPGVVQRPRNVLDVDRVPAVRRLEPEGAERLEVPLQRHQVDPAPVIPILLLRRAPLRQEKRDQG